MVIDRIGGVSPGYGPRKTGATSKPEKPAAASDNVSISAEASRAADASRIARMAKNSQDLERAEKLRNIKEKLANGEYDNLSEDMLSSMASNLISGKVEQE